MINEKRISEQRVTDALIKAGGSTTLRNLRNSLRARGHMTIIWDEILKSMVKGKAIWTEGTGRKGDPKKVGLL